MSFKINLQNKLVISLIIAILSIAVLAYLYIYFQKPKPDELSIVRDLQANQNSQIIAGKPVEWTVLVNKELITENNHLLELPKTAVNIKLTNADKEQAKEILANLKNQTQNQTDSVLAKEQRQDTYNIATAGLLGGIKNTISDIFTKIFQNISKKLNPKITQTNQATYLAVENQLSEKDYLVLTYTTPGPKIKEKVTPNGTIVTISNPNDPNLEYKNVLAYSAIPEIYNKDSKNRPQIKWQNNDNQLTSFKAHDLNNNGKLDYIEWTVPHLSEQVFEIIYISKAFHLDKNLEIIEDIYDNVRAKEATWQEGTYSTIPQENYVRAAFEKTLTSANDITLFARPNPDTCNSQECSVAVEVYPVYTDENGNQTHGQKLELVADGSNPDFSNINKETAYRILLKNLQQPTDVFDLKVVYSTSDTLNLKPSLDLDLVIDPTAGIDWTALIAAINFGTHSAYSVAYGADKFVVVGDYGKASYSADGVTWTALTAGTDTGIKFGTTTAALSVTYGADKFVVVGNSGLASYSADGVTWTALTAGTSSGIRFGTTGAYSVTYGADKFVVVGGSGKASYSADGVTWTVLTAGTDTGIKFGTSTTSSTARSVTYGADKFVVVGAYGKASYSYTEVPNTAPTITSGPSDSGSSSNYPTISGNNVVFTATAIDSDSDNYYLAICKTDSITANNESAPTCDGGNWCISTSTASESQATCSYTTSAGDLGSQDWYAFVCDHNASSECSVSNQSSGDNGSPFAVMVSSEGGAGVRIGSGVTIGSGVQITAESGGGEWTCGDTLVDTRDSKEYDTVLIGDQCWMAENLDYDSECTGVTWANNVDNGWCGYYTGGPYPNEGLLYQWSAVMAGSTAQGTQGICPEGWHIPTDAEIHIIELMYWDGATGGCNLNSQTTQCSPAGDILRKAGLCSGRTPCGTSGFDALHAGYRETSNGTFYSRNSSAYFWTSTESSPGYSFRRGVFNYSATVYRDAYNTKLALSIRCLKN